MCGIFGVSLPKGFSEHTQLDAVSTFKRLMFENTSRGKDSTGVVYINGNECEVYQTLLEGSQAHNFILPEEDTNAIFGHVRYATVGGKTDFKNVHPFVTDKYIGVHNGTVFNHKLIKKHFGLTPKGSCDSEIIFRLMDKLGEKAFSYLEGLFTIAYTEMDDTDTLCVITNGSRPLQFIQVKGKYTAFGSIADKTLELLTKEVTDGDLNTFEIKPCILYKIKNGEIASTVDYTKTIKFVSSEEGELRFKLEYKNLKADLYNEAIPIYRRLPAPQIDNTVVHNKTTSATTFGYEKAKKKYAAPDSLRSNIMVQDWFKERMGVLRRLMEDFALSTNREGIDFKVRVTALGNMYTSYGNHNSNNKNDYVIIKNREDKYHVLDSLIRFNGTMIEPDILLACIASGKSISLFHQKNPHYMSGYDKTILSTPAANVIAGALCAGKHQSIYQDLVNYIEESMVKTGILFPTITPQDIPVVTPDDKSIYISKLNCKLQKEFYLDAYKDTHYSWAGLSYYLDSGAVSVAEYTLGQRVLYLFNLYMFFLEALATKEPCTKTIFDTTIPQYSNIIGSKFTRDLIEMFLKAYYMPDSTLGLKDIVEFIDRAANLDIIRYCRAFANDITTFGHPFRSMFLYCKGVPPKITHDYCTDAPTGFGLAIESSKEYYHSIITLLERSLRIRSVLVERKDLKELPTVLSASLARNYPKGVNNNE